jgi:carbonic anhydrase/acetyltransferase-like protein (isoleucine patch superfamily)
VATHDFKDGQGPVEAHQHPNGGGWVANTASVDDSAYAGPRARVYGDAGVRDNASVEDNAHVFGDAQVYGNARVCDNATASGDAQIGGTTQIFGTAWVYGEAWIYGNARVFGSAWIYGNTEVCGEAQVYGNAQVYGDSKIHGFVRVFGESRCSESPISVGHSDYIITITDNFVHIEDQTSYSFSSELPLKEPYLSFVRSVIDQRKPRVERASFWSKLGEL